MPTIATNTYRLPIAEKLQKGQIIITQSTDNPNVPGNDDALARFAAAQAQLDAASAAFAAIQTQAKQLLAARDIALADWNTSLNGLAGVTESITGGSPEKILSAGFDVRSPKTPKQRVAQVEALQVSFDEVPGYSNLAWKPDPNADIYRIESSPDPVTDESWEECGMSTEAKFRTNGATPGQRRWYRVAAFNNLGLGPWSGPASRPLL